MDGIVRREEDGTAGVAQTLVVVNVLVAGTFYLVSVVL